ncbi:hypothetical protein ACC740_37590, partial [Rhizobium ruizarguesonis]
FFDSICRQRRLSDVEEAWARGVKILNVRLSGLRIVKLFRHPVTPSLLLLLVEVLQESRWVKKDISWTAFPRLVAIDAATDEERWK